MKKPNICIKKIVSNGSALMANVSFLPWTVTLQEYTQLGKT